MTTLPLEVTDDIIDIIALQQPKQRRATSNLAACSLVCRGWTPRSRFHFFTDCSLLIRVNYKNTVAFGKSL
jgi:hypothetical protein